MLLRARYDGIANQRPFRRPFDLVFDRSRRLDELSSHASSSINRLLIERAGRLATVAGKIESLSPLAVLARGYTITKDAETGTAIRAADQLLLGQSIVTRFAIGEAVSKVEAIE
jgi:exodeoxyribonuclease VII large subunit